MSINFNNDVTPEIEEMIKTLFGDAVAHDERTFLFDKKLGLDRKKMTEIANKAKQPFMVEINSDGEIKTMKDGTKYRCTKRGWIKIK